MLTHFLFSNSHWLSYYLFVQYFSSGDQWWWYITMFEKFIHKKRVSILSINFVYKATHVENENTHQFKSKESHSLQESWKFERKFPSSHFIPISLLNIPHTTKNQNYIPAWKQKKIMWERQAASSNKNRKKGKEKLFICTTEVRKSRLQGGKIAIR